LTSSAMGPPAFPEYTSRIAAHHCGLGCKARRGGTQGRRLLHATVVLSRALM
jgi:hypothetical protein